ncbi:DUF3750 domain-containing protein [Rhizobium sp. CFBP 8762]|uniref:DUF3750 domain-containing protein n=1 Tax=Rhizobium sp. CFBP 8762 TaxID=2775279 RepID=UPI001781BAB4|nr:DUF3750 domain-containing protein [Rhizobium sp. CFBP 8762]MBD8556237.1 DUF3750 domain-containing protein [Rhizobium sp. CFBP 8762]
MKFFKLLMIAISIVYFLPVIVAAALWVLGDHPASWRDATWSSAGILPPAKASPDAAIYIFSAKTGGFKGAVSSHSWIVTKAEGDQTYNRYDKVGWGSPIRRNGYPADAFWYSNPPQIIKKVEGAEAARLIPQVEKAIQGYPYSKPGGYQIFPGPNSNTFVAHVLRSVPDLGVVLPPDAVGRDYLPEGRFFAIDADHRDVHATLFGLAGISAGLRSGLEVHFLGLVAGLDIMRPGIKIPVFGRFGV